MLKQEDMHCVFNREPALPVFTFTRCGHQFLVQHVIGKPHRQTWEDGLRGQGEHVLLFCRSGYPIGNPCLCFPFGRRPGHHSS